MTTTHSLTPLAAAVALLDRAAEQCSARGDTAAGLLDDLTTWYLDALQVSWPPRPCAAPPLLSCRNRPISPQPAAATRSNSC